MTEIEARDKLRNIFKNAHYVRLESTVGAGVPDINICHRGVEVWIEAKIFISGRVFLRKEQYAWGMRRSSHKGTVWVVAWHPTGWHSWLFPNITPIAHGNSDKYVTISALPHIRHSDFALRELLFPS